MAIFPS